jgi:Ribonuclease P/MRP, subunit p29
MISVRKATELGAWKFDKRLAKSVCPSSNNLGSLYSRSSQIQVGNVLANTPAVARVYFGTPRSPSTPIGLPREQLASIESPRPKQYSAQTRQGGFPWVYNYWCDTPTPFCIERSLPIPVRQCRNASRIGCTGIVMQETANTFKIVTKANTLKGMTFSSVVGSSFSSVTQSSQSKELFLQSPCPISHYPRLLRKLTLGSTLNYTETSSDSVQLIVPLENSRQKRPPNYKHERGLPPSIGHTRSKFFSSLLSLPSFCFSLPFRQSLSKAPPLQTLTYMTK